MRPFSSGMEDVDDDYRVVPRRLPVEVTFIKANLVRLNIYLS